MTPELASATQHRPAHLLLGQCPLPVTFQMVALILPMAKDCESHWLSPCSGWRSCHTLRWDSTTKCTRGCEGRGGRLRLRLDSTSDSTAGLMVPEAALPLYRLHIHICDSSQATHTLSGRMSASVGCCGGSSHVGPVGLRMRTSSSKPWETAHKQGMQEHDRIHQNNLRGRATCCG